ncbi:MAG TPA: hypothetical protein VF790_11760 [Dissulfurispiraceae bacterium]
MDGNIAFIISIITGTFLIGMLIVRFLLRRASVIKDADNTLRVHIPVLGEMTFRSFPKPRGIVVKEVLELKANLDMLKQFLDMDSVLGYAGRFKINYIGVEGDREDGSWSPGRLAYCTMSNTVKGGYNIYLNPNLDLQDISERLSRDLETPIPPPKVYPFLFLHEVGHTTEAGNQDFYTAMVNYALSGGRNSTKRRKELNKLKVSIEKFADEFALRELSWWREKTPVSGSLKFLAKRL